MSPREESAREYLLSASRVLQAEELHEKALDPFLLQAEFFVSPLGPVGPLWVDLSAHVDHAPRKAVVQGAQNPASGRFVISSSSLPPSWASCFPSEPRFAPLENGGVEIIGMLQG